MILLATIGLYNVEKPRVLAKRSVHRLDGSVIHRKGHEHACCGTFD